MGKYIYLVSNPSIPNHYKIGVSGRLENRVKDLSRNSGRSLDVIHKRYINRDWNRVEKLIHKELEKYRLDGFKEWFSFEPELLPKVINVINSTEYDYVGYIPVRSAKTKDYIVAHKLLNFGVEDSLLVGVRFPVLCTKANLLKASSYTAIKLYSSEDFGDLLNASDHNLFVLLPVEYSDYECNYLLSSINNYFKLYTALSSKTYDIEDYGELTYYLSRVSVKEANELLSYKHFTNCSTVLQLRIYGAYLSYSYYLPDSIEALLSLSALYPPYEVGLRDLYKN